MTIDAAERETEAAVAAEGAAAAPPVLVVENLRTYFDLRRGLVKAVDGMSFTLAPRAHSIKAPCSHWCATR